MAKATKAALMDELDDLLGSSAEENNEDDESPDDTTDDEEGSGEGDTDAEDTDGEGDADGDAGGEEPDDTEEGAGGGTEVDAAAAAKAAADPLRNPDGTFKSKEQLDAEKKGKQPDHINDPIPENLKKETQDRMRALVSTAKTVTAERDNAVQQFNTIVQGIQATNTTPEQYQELLSFMSLFNSRDPNQQEQALGVARDFVERLSLMLGKELTFTDPLEQHADLKAAVAQGQITKQWATELARQRMSQGFRTQIQQTQNQQVSQQEQAQQEDRQARMTLTSYETQLRQQDPLYEMKKEYLLPILKPLFAGMPPREWPQRFAAAYQNIPANVVAQLQQQARAAKASGNGRQQGKTMPLRAGKGNPGGGGKMKSKSGSPLDALNEGLAQLNK